MRNNKKTKNDRSWEKIFEEDKILQTIEQYGFCEISSERINQERESRLMAKFDHRVNLPDIFKQHHLSILPTSRNQYIIGYFETYLQVQDNDEIQPNSIDFLPWIESIDYTNLYSESAVLNCAFNTGIIARLFNEEMLYTVSGRMSTDRFKFQIKNVKEKNHYWINVANSQCEIDAGFEGESKFLIIEAKIGKVQDFIIRQLYYPYRLWSSKISKPVIPILLTYSNDVFDFCIYEFENDLNYNSIGLCDRQKYRIGYEEISRDDVSDVWNKITVVPEPESFPFPQANNFARVIDLLSLLVEKALSKEEITANYQFDLRQTQYYTDAARYLGLIDKSSGRSNSEITFNLTSLGKSLMKKRHKYKILKLIQTILEHQVFYRVFSETLRIGEIPPQKEIVKLMISCNLGLNETTIFRRSSTVKRWIEWIWSQIE